MTSPGQPSVPAVVYSMDVSKECTDNMEQNLQLGPRYQALKQAQQQWYLWVMQLVSLYLKTASCLEYRE